jgi:hypothetical protein
VANAAVGTELDLGVPLADARKSVGFVARDSVTLTSHPLDRYRVAAEPRDEPIAFLGLARATGGERETSDNEVSHATTFDHRTAPRKTRSGEVMMQAVGLLRSVDGYRSAAGGQNGSFERTTRLNWNLRFL